jgi:hypothetical protein
MRRPSVIDDEGHSMVKLSNKLATYPQAVEFVGRHI